MTDVYVTPTHTHTQTSLVIKVGRRREVGEGGSRGKEARAKSNRLARKGKLSFLLLSTKVTMDTKSSSTATTTTASSIFDIQMKLSAGGLK